MLPSGFNVFKVCFRSSQWGLEVCDYAVSHRESVSFDRAEGPHADCHATRHMPGHFEVNILFRSVVIFLSTFSFAISICALTSSINVVDKNKRTPRHT